MHKFLLLNGLRSDEGVVLSGKPTETDMKATETDMKTAETGVETTETGVEWTGQQCGE
jgi:hypothetical protein